MNSDPDLVRYACIAHKSSHDSSSTATILAELNSADAGLQELAHQCLDLAPPHHSMYSHSYKNQAYTYLINDMFIYFGVFDANMLKYDQIRFLSRLKEALDILFKGNPNQFKFSSHCFQGELHPIFLRLMSKSLDFDSLHLVPNGVHSVGTPPNGSGSSKSQSRKILSVPLLSQSKMAVKGHKKKRYCGESAESKEALVDGKVDMLDDVGVCEVKSREIVCQNGVCMIDGAGSSGGGRQKAKKIWRRHVYIVLVLDLAVCLILFGIWLFVCRGFQCIEG